MILQSLVHYYEMQAAAGVLPIPGWSPARVSYALDLTDSGEIENVISLKVPDESGRKMIPQSIILPVQEKRSSGIKPNFLCDNSFFLLGFRQEEKEDADKEKNRYKKEKNEKHGKECFKASAEFHVQLLSSCKNPAAIALVNFFNTWDPEKFTSVFQDEKQQKDISAGNIVFLYKGQYLHEIEEIRQIWQDYYSAPSEGEKRVCLVTGRKEVPTRIHPNIKGIPGAEPSGASLVSFNSPVLCSYGHKQGMNAPISEYAAFAYSTALNHLIATQHTRIGNITVLFWAENAEDKYRSLMDFCCWGNTREQYNEEDLINAVKSICCGNPVELNGELIDPNMKFYILGIAPNAARLSVRFFLQNSFGSFIKNVNEHQERLRLLQTGKYQKKTIHVWEIINAVLNKKKKSPSNPQLEQELIKSIFNNTPYPVSLLKQAENRIYADHDVDTIRVGIIKAYHLKKLNSGISKEVLQMGLNPDSNSAPYVLGRFFFLLESIQESVNSDINASFKDKYFNYASIYPAKVFPSMIKTSQYYLKKLKDNRKLIYYDKQLMELIDKLDGEFPKHLNQNERGEFMIGYYHQKVKRYTKKEENKEEPKEEKENE